MFNRLLDLLYHQKTLRRTHRPADKPMEVLCLGLPHSETDSISSALKTLRYNDVYDSSVVAAQQRNDCAFWVPLLERKHKSGRTRLEGIDFDTVLENHRVVIDGPACIFGEELMAYYPKAKVILNRRRDMNAWFSSTQDRSQEMFSWWMWMLSWVDGRLYWLWRMSYLVMYGYYDDDFKGNGKGYAKAHYVDLQDYLKDHGREYLEWSVEDGWEPLCRFLDKPIPEEKFPRDLCMKGKTQANAIKATRDMLFSATRNLSIIVLLTSVIAWYWRNTLLLLLVMAYRLSQRSTVSEEIFPNMEI